MPEQDYKQLDAESFKGSLGTYKLVKTNDNTCTLWSEYFDECCHSIDGADKETIYNYIQGTKVLEQSKLHNPLNIFEIGFALGIGASSTFKALEQSTKSPCIYISCELDQLLVEWSIKNNKSTFKFYPSISELKLKSVSGLSFFEAQKGNSKIIVLLGNARETIPLAKKLLDLPKFHCLYQDAFSPKKNPTLWTQQWFELLKSISEAGAYISTYSAATPVRKSMHLAGWGVCERAGFNGKKSSTYAILNKNSEQKIIEKLNRSPLEPLRDKNE